MQSLHSNPISRSFIYAAKPVLPYSPSLITSTPTSACLRTASETPLRKLAVKFVPLYGTPLTLARMTSMISSGRVRLPTWVVRILPLLHCISSLRGLPLDLSESATPITRNAAKCPPLFNRHFSLGAVVLILRSARRGTFLEVTIEIRGNARENPRRQSGAVAHFECDYR